jgi:chromosome partitioning protein
VLGELLDLIGNVRQHANRRLTIAGFLVNQVKARTGYHRQVVEHLRSELAHSRVYETTIPDSIRVQEAAQARLPVIRFDPDCPAAVAYRQLAREVLAHAG